MTELNIYFGLILLLAAMTISTLATVTCLQVFLLRNKRLSWRVGTLKGFPLFSTLFLIVSIVMFISMFNIGSFWKSVASWLYLVIACSWFISSYFSSKNYITDNGIVKNINDPTQTIAWFQIHDFFEQKIRDEWSYTFIYREKDQNKLDNLARLELEVPEDKHEAFKKLISRKLGRRISCYEEEAIDINQFE